MSDMDDELGEEEEMGPYIGEYEGERNEKEERHGHGKAILPNKDLYDGNYMNGKRDGYGVYKFKSKAANGARYMGEYCQGKKQGFGIFIYPDGSRYEGNFVDDLKDGNGKYYYTNGDTYEGEWSQGLRHGKGTYIFAKDNTKYVGSWRKGKWEGFGEFHYANYKYVGRFRDNKMFGYGKYVFDHRAELHGQYVPVSSDEAKAMDLEQEALYITTTDVHAAEGEGEEAVQKEPELRMPPSPPPVGPTRFIYGQITGLHILTKEEEEEAKMVEELNALRTKVEAQIAAKEEEKRKRAERAAAKRARKEAERAALEAVAQETAVAEDQKVDDGQGSGEDGEGGEHAAGEDNAGDLEGGEGGEAAALAAEAAPEEPAADD